MDRYAFLFQSMSLEQAKEVLGFPPTAHPSPSDIQKAYRQKAFENHPDRGGDPDKMVEVNVAKDLLEGKAKPEDEGAGEGATEYGQPVRTRWTPPEPEVTTFEEAKSQAGIPGGVEWLFVTDSQRGTGYSSDEFYRSSNYWVAFGKVDDNSYVFVGLHHFSYQELYIGGRANQDHWNIISNKVSADEEKAKTPAWIYGRVVDTLKRLNFKGKFNSKVVDAKGWKFDDKMPKGPELSIKHWLAETGQVEQDDPRVQSRKHVVEIKYLDQYEKSNTYRIEKYKGDTYGSVAGLEIIINGKSYFLDKDDVQAFFRVRLGGKHLIDVIFGTYYYGGTKKQVTRLRNSKLLLEWMAEKLTSLPQAARDTLKAAADQKK
jgi:hypothetical protein